MSYLAYICYRQSYGDDDELLGEVATLEFAEPHPWEYDKIIPIQFSPLSRWTDKDKGTIK
jgi:hypothetical protein